MSCLALQLILPWWPPRVSAPTLSLGPSPRLGVEDEKVVELLH